MKAILVALLMLVCGSAFAQLTNSQVNTLKTFVAQSSDPTLIDARTRGDTGLCVNALNAANSPVTLGWGVAITADILDGGATYTTYDSLTQGKRDEWDIFLRYAPRNMAKSKNRNTVTDVWGNATAGSVAEAILQAATENATVAQVAIGGTSRTTGTVTALDRNYTGRVTTDECQRILAP